MTSAAPISLAARLASFVSPPFLRAILVIVAVGVVWSPAPADAKVFLTVGEALELAFPGCEMERRTVFLEKEDLEAARRAAGVEIESGLIHPYVATCDGEPGGVAYFDSHRVRTLPETVMVAVDPRGRVIRVEVVVFREPEEYIPRHIWYEQFDGKPLTDDLDLKRDIRNMTGATLTARATTEAVRRVLALHQVVDPEPSTEPSTEAMTEADADGARPAEARQ